MYELINQKLRQWKDSSASKLTPRSRWHKDQNGETVSSCLYRKSPSLRVRGPNVCLKHKHVYSAAVRRSNPTWVQQSWHSSKQADKPIQNRSLQIIVKSPQKPRRFGPENVRLFCLLCHYYLQIKEAIETHTIPNSQSLSKR